jgi:hypothetical protein
MAFRRMPRLTAGHLVDEATVTKLPSASAKGNPFDSVFAPPGQQIADLRASTPNRTESSLGSGFVAARPEGAHVSAAHLRASGYADGLTARHAFLEALKRFCG